ncbi:MAG: hydrolase [Bacteroidales bacterium]|jgi:nicotinamidase-related amidase|nr:hydrolase [Bacteroidales bacterium]
MRILRDQTAGLVIDIQEKLFPYISGHETLALNAGILIKGLQVLGVPVIVTEQYTKGLGPTVGPIRELFTGGQPVEKLAFSCCDEPKFLTQLSVLEKKFIVITGIESHVCVLQTAIDLLEKDFIPVIVEDCVSSRRLNDKHMAIARMRRLGAVITTYESVLFELLRYSGTDEFKAISKLVK